MIMEHAHLAKMGFMLESMKLIMFIKFSVCFANFHAKHVPQLVNVLRNTTLRIYTQILLGEENVRKDNLNPKAMESVFLVGKVASIATNMVFAYNVKLLIIWLMINKIFLCHIASLANQGHSVLKKDHSNLNKIVGLDISNL